MVWLEPINLVQIEHTNPWHIFEINLVWSCHTKNGMPIQAITSIYLFSASNTHAYTQDGNYVPCYVSWALSNMHTHTCTLHKCTSGYTSHTKHAGSLYTFNALHTIYEGTRKTPCMLNPGFNSHCLIAKNSEKKLLQYYMYTMISLSYKPYSKPMHGCNTDLLPLVVHAWPGIWVGGSLRHSWTLRRESD